MDDGFQPLFSKEIEAYEALRYVDYYGINTPTIVRLGQKYHNLIIDNSPAFFARSLAGVGTFYSTRKFIGVPAGAYVYAEIIVRKTMEQGLSCERCAKLLKRLDRDVASGSQDYQSNEEIISAQQVKSLSLFG